MAQIMKSAVSRFFYPSWLLLTVLGSYAMIVSGFAEATTVILFFFASCGVILALEWWMPFKREWVKPQKDIKTDIAHFFLSAGVTVSLIRALLYIPLFMLASYVSSIIPFALWPAKWPLLIQFVLVVILVDFFTYWVHRFMHTVDFLWRIHSVHHSVSRLYSFNSVRVHPFETILFYVAQTAPMVLLGAPVELMAMFTCFIGVTSLLQHCNIDIRYGVFNSIFSTSDLHRWHHSKIVKEALNYGDNLIIWDIVFGSYYLPDRNGPAELGIGGAIREYPQNYIGQILAPFTWKRLAYSNNDTARPKVSGEHD
ncbi:sterol desaturase family protein [Gynuella sunshinyii]|uniref:Sterol desaturase n=1 Tax=Gynuella sunshinyii YC6258 TaxID=1445510 RepID=A0A0C5W4C1_9GAMM|nr:sterol desaturase family protein [Gynuella sunshinyii]AJQ97474.1 sterol desaturase [Gynuella sunshinyii YC6258]